MILLYDTECLRSSAVFMHLPGIENKQPNIDSAMHLFDISLKIVLIHIDSWKAMSKYARVEEVCHLFVQAFLQKENICDTNCYIMLS